MDLLHDARQRLDQHLDGVGIILFVDIQIFLLVLQEELKSYYKFLVIFRIRDDDLREIRIVSLLCLIDEHVNFLKGRLHLDLVVLGLAEELSELFL